LDKVITSLWAIVVIFCSNASIEGVNWESCDSINNPGVKILYSCSFNHSTSRAFTLSEVLETCPLTIISLQTIKIKAVDSYFRVIG